MSCNKLVVLILWPPSLPSLSAKLDTRAGPYQVHTITSAPVSMGKVTMLGPWVGLHKPVEVKYLHRAGGHGIASYIEQLKHVV